MKIYILELKISTLLDEGNDAYEVYSNSIKSENFEELKAIYNKANGYESKTANFTPTKNHIQFTLSLYEYDEEQDYLYGIRRKHLMQKSMQVELTCELFDFWKLVKTKCVTNSDNKIN